MYAMNFDITIGPFRLTTLESVVVTRSVENLADTATITLPGAVCSYAPELETMLGEGDPVCIRLGYDARGHCREREDAFPRWEIPLASKVEGVI